MPLSRMGSEALRLYEHLVDHGPTTVEDLARVVPSPIDSLNWLRENGFVLGDPPRARRPRQALSVALTQAADTLDRLNALVQDLDDRYRERYSGEPSVATVLTTRQEVVEAFDSLQRSVRTEWMQMFTAPFVPLAPPLPPEQSEVPHTDLRCRRRLLYEKEVLAVPAAMAGLRNTMRWGGAEIRLTDRVPTKLLVVDNKVALTPLRERGSLPMLMVQAAPLVAGQIALFEREWAKATPYNAVAGSVSIPTQLGEQDRLILQQVIAGETDKTIARLCNVSPRTVGRSIQRMREMAGVGTRGQLIHYATKHWL